MLPHDACKPFVYSSDNDNHVQHARAGPQYGDDDSDSDRLPLMRKPSAAEQATLAGVTRAPADDLRGGLQ
eukprot:656519-Pyramimonas_sp.AAC.1